MNTPNPPPGSGTGALQATWNRRLLVVTAGLAGCTGGGGAAVGHRVPGEPYDITGVVSSEVATVVKVRWSTEESTVGHVEFGTSTTDEFATPPTETGTEHEALLLGVPADSDVHYRVVSTAGGDRIESEEQVARTGPVPNNLSVLDVAGVGVGGFACLPVVGRESAELIVNSEGQIVWYHQNENLPWHSNSRCLLSADGQAVLFNHNLDVDLGNGVYDAIFRTALDGSGTTSVSALDAVSHDFTQLPDGTIAAIVKMISVVGDGITIRDAIVEVDPDGTLLEIWNGQTYFDDYRAEELTANALDYDPIDDAYYLNMLELGAILKIDRASGEVLWEMGGPESDFIFLPPTRPFTRQHQFEFRGDSLLVFNNAAEHQSDTASVRHFVVDWEAGTLREDWTLPSDYVVVALGSVETIADDALAVSWSAAGAYTELVGGETVLSIHGRFGCAFGYASHLETLYPVGAR